ncbi:transcriptional regulator, LysR family protein [Marinomonas sp. MED121]|nr:transcriptional regulator, LysR family protein [Marinomonas sp. MED121]
MKRLFFMSNNDLNQIRIFTHVAQLASFTKAAEVLGIEKSTVSAKVSQLEASLGIRLLERTTRSVRLTEAGRDYLAYCEQALNTLQQGDDYIHSLSGEPSGTIRFCAPHNLIDFILSSVIEPFLTCYPKVNLEIHQVNGDEGFLSGNYDLAIRNHRGEIKDTSLICRPLFESQWVFVISPKQLDEFGYPETPEHLLSQPSIGLKNASTNKTYDPHLIWQDQKLNFRHRFAVDNMRTVIASIKLGLGFGMVPKNMVKEELAQGELVEIIKDIVIPPTSLYLIYPSRVGQPAKLIKFIDALMQWSKMNK